MAANPASPAAVETVQARVVESRQQQVPVNVRSTGTVHARETALVSAQVLGRIQQVLVREGDSVRAGQTLAVLDDAALARSVDQAQAGVKAAQSEAGRRTNRRQPCRQHFGALPAAGGREERKPAGDG